MKWKSRDNNHPELHPGQFDFYCNASPSRAPTWSRSSFSPYALVFLCTRLPTHSSFYVLDFLWWQGKMVRKDNKKGPASVWDCPLVKVCSLSSLIVIISDKKVEAVGWTQSTLFPYVVVSLIISIDQSNWLDNERSPLVCYQFNNKGPSSVSHRVFREAGSMRKVWRIPTFNMSSG